MAVKRTLMLELDAADAVLLERITRHLRQPAAQTLRQCLRHYAHVGPWPLGTNGLREQVLSESESARGNGTNGKGRKGVKR